jgi:ferredoxin
MSRIISRENVSKLVDSLIAVGTTVAGPVATSGKKFFFQTLQTAESLVLDSSVMPDNSIKEFLFPQHETICNYRRDGKELVLLDTEPFDKSQVVFGARPCDAASLPILDKVFAWDFQDRFYQRRREGTIVVSLACKADENCFCTSVGLAPDTQSGSDAMLLNLGDGSFEVRIFTDKGKVLFDGKTMESDKISRPAELPQVRFDVQKVEKYLAEHFDDPLIYSEVGLRCIGCGACTYICPTCHCFDIVDEGGPAKGKRVKNWDACQFAMFTHHASGHNPRNDQAARQRNRIQHKFRIYPEKFGAILCTGCGNCTRVCSASLGVRPLLELIDKK